MPDVEPVELPCSKGDIIFMNKFTPHRSTPNQSNRCRWSLDLRYQTTGHHTGRTGHPDFVVRSPSDANNVMRDYNIWCERWIDALGNTKDAVTHRND